MPTVCAASSSTSISMSLCCSLCKPAAGLWWMCGFLESTQHNTTPNHHTRTLQQRAVQQLVLGDQRGAGRLGHQAILHVEVCPTPHVMQPLHPQVAGVRGTKISPRSSQQQPKPCLVAAKQRLDVCLVSSDHAVKARAPRAQRAQHGGGHGLQGRGEGEARGCESNRVGGAVLTNDNGLILLL